MPGICCLNCRRVADDLKQCSRCKIAKYCNESCQKSSLKLHRKNCKELVKQKQLYEQQYGTLAPFRDHHPFHPMVSYSWDFLRFTRCNVELEEAPELLKTIMRTLKMMACIEGNLLAAREFVVMDWVHRHRYDLSDVSKRSDIPLMLLALGHRAEALLFLKKVALDILGVKDYPMAPPKGPVFTPEQLQQREKDLTGPDSPDTFEQLFKALDPAELYFLYLCRGADHLAWERAVEASGDPVIPVYHEILSEDPWFKEMRSMSQAVYDLTKKAEKEAEPPVSLQWAVHQGFSMHLLNQWILDGILDPFRLSVNCPDWTTAYREEYESADPASDELEKMDYFGVDTQETITLHARSVLLRAMPLVRLAGFEKELKEMAMRTMSYAAEVLSK